MIPQLLELTRRRAQAGDVVAKTDETLSLTFDAGRLATSSLAIERGYNLRVVAEGRAGVAGTTGDNAEGMVEAALAAARAGAPIEFLLPEPNPWPRVVTRVPRAAAATLEELRDLGQMAHDRMAGDARRVDVAVERSVGSVRVANTAGLDASYEVSLVGVLVEVSDDHWSPIVSAALIGADLPLAEELERFVDGLRLRTGWSRKEVKAPRGHLPVCFLPAAANALILPVRQALLGRTAVQGLSPLKDRIGERVYDQSLTVTDDPLVDARPGSRPLDDEGVPSRALSLVREGVVRNLAYDLETAARAGTRSTGHARRTTFGKPEVACTNVMVAPGPHSFETLLSLVGDGLIVEDLPGLAAGQVAGGGFISPAVPAWRIAGGEVVGRVAGVTLAGNAHELLARIRGIGADSSWLASRASAAANMAWNLGSSRMGSRSGSDLVVATRALAHWARTGSRAAKAA
ncbi:MAG: TldD/PmbA family protein, partial [Gemmatimonadales bacterium]